MKLRSPALRTRLREVTEPKGIHPLQLALHLDVCPVTIQRYFSGGDVPLSKALALSKLLEIPVEKIWSLD